MDHGFKTQNLTLIKEDGSNNETDVRKLNNGFVFKNELMDLAIDASNDGNLDVISIKIGKPFIESDQIFHLLPAKNEEGGDTQVDFNPMAEERRGGNLGCIPRWFILKNGDDFSVYNKPINDDHFLIPLAIANHGPDPDQNFPYECETAYFKVDQNNLNSLNNSIQQLGPNMQGGLDKDDYDLRSKFCNKLTLYWPEREERIVVHGIEFNMEDLS